MQEPVIEAGNAANWQREPARRRIFDAATGLGNRALWYTAGRLSLPAPPRG